MIAAKRLNRDGDQVLYEIQAPGGAVASHELEDDSYAGNQYGRVLYTHGPGIDQPLDIIRMGHNPPAGYGFEEWGGPYPVLPFGNWRGTLVGGTTAEGVKLPCPDGECLVYWPGSRYRAFLERDRPVHQRNWFGSLTAGQENPNGLMYMRNRYYNPLTGAFTQTDPIGLAGGLNSYGYAEGNPVTYSDPYGLQAEDAAGDPPGWKQRLMRLAFRICTACASAVNQAGATQPEGSNQSTQPVSSQIRQRVENAASGRTVREHQTTRPVRGAGPRPGPGEPPAPRIRGGGMLRGISPLLLGVEIYQELKELQKHPCERENNTCA